MRAAPLLALALLLPGCGFQLRGAADLPFQTVYVSGSGTIVLEIKRNIEASSRTVVVDDPKVAQAVLEFTQETRQKDILSLSAAGRVLEFRLLYRVGFRVRDGKGGEYLPVSTLQLSRDITYTDADVLAKEAEEQLLFRDMQSDAVRQIVRRLAEAKKPKSATP